MATTTITLRAGYAAWAGYRTLGRMWCAVSEDVGVGVESLAPGEAPVACRVVRPYGGDTAEDRHAWDVRHGRPTLVERGRHDLQRFDLRLSAKGLLAPVLGPDAVGPLTPVALAGYDADWNGDFLTRHARAMLAWRSRPGQSPLPRRKWGSGESWPIPARGAPGRPVHLCEDLATSGLTVDPGMRREALDAFRARVEGLCLVGGTLWRPCGSPLVAMDRWGSGRVVVPGMDPDGDVSGRGAGAALAYRDACLAAHPGVALGQASVEASGAVTPPASAEAATLDAIGLASHVASAVARVRIGNLRPSWLPLVHCLAMVQAGERDEAHVAKVAPLVDDALGAWDDGRPAAGSHDAKLLALATLWRDVRRAG